MVVVVNVESDGFAIDAEAADIAADIDGRLWARSADMLVGRGFWGAENVIVSQSELWWLSEPALE